MAVSRHFRLEIFDVGPKNAIQSRMIFRAILISASLIFSSQIAYSADRCDSLFASENEFGVPKNIQSKFPKLAQSQPQAIQINHQTILVHNQQVAARLKQIQGTPNSSTLRPLIKLLDQNGAFHFPLTEDGFLPAANNGDHHGGYGSFVWLRDLARASSGVSALPKLLKKVGQPTSVAENSVTDLNSAMLRLFSEKDQIVRTLKNILNPEFQLDPHNGFRNVIFVRLGIEGRKKGKTPTKEQIEEESRWGHKQNDALALYGHSLLDSIARGEIKSSELSLETKAELVYLVSYFQRIRYATVEDVGAWEERMGVRTSSIGLVTSFLERFHNGWQKKVATSKAETAFFKDLRQNWDRGYIRTHLNEFIKNNASEFSTQQSDPWDVLFRSIEDLPLSIADSYGLLFKRLGVGTDANGNRQSSDLSEVAGSQNARGADAALLHMLLYPPQRLTVSDRLHIIEKLKSELMRPSGMARYKDDWFLYGGPSAVEFASRLPFNPDMIAVKDQNGYRPSALSDRDQVYTEFIKQKYDKDMSAIVEKSGPGLDAQWSFQDSMLTQIFVKLYLETGNKYYIDQAWFHLARALAAVTGAHQINIEGATVQDFRAPEAWIPVKLIDQGQEFTVYFASPNSPLNWTTAELVTALNQYVEVKLSK